MTDRLEDEFWDGDCEQCLRQGDFVRQEHWQRYEKEPAWVEHIKDKGDLFYVEPYDEPPSCGSPSLEHLNLSNTKTGKTKKAVFRKLKSVKNLFAGTNSEKHLDSSMHEENLKNSLEMWDSRDIKMTDKFPIKDVHLTVMPRRLHSGARHDLETLLGIIPGQEKMSKMSTENNGYSGARICIKGFVPDGPALQSGELKISDVIISLNKLDINSSNVNIILAAITDPMEIVLRVQRPLVPSPVIRSKSAPAKSDSHLIKLVSGEPAVSSRPDTKDLPHVALYLTLTSSEDDEPDKDILYQYPVTQAATRLLSLRGLFLTLSDLMAAVTGSNANSSTLVLEKKLVHVGYSKMGKHVLVIGLPAERIPLPVLQKIISDVARILTVTFGSLDRAFCEKCNKARLDHFFSLLFDTFLCSKSCTNSSDTSNRFPDLLPGVRWLNLPTSTQMQVHDCLNDLEAADYGELVDIMFEDRRRYSFLGSCIFYKGFLVCNHLATDVFEDVALYCKYYCLLTMSSEQRVGQLVIWNELTLRRSRTSDERRPVYQEPAGRHFLLIIGLKHWLLCVLLEAGVVAKRAEGNPRPDIFYVDQVKNTLLQIEALDIPSVCEARLRSAPVPSVVSADHLLLHPAAAAAVERKVSNPDPDTPPQRKKYSSLDNLRLPGDDVDSSDSGSNPPLRQKGSDSSGSTNSLNNKGKLRSYRSQLSLNSVGTLRKSFPDSALDLSQMATTKLTGGQENTLLQYLGFDSLHGIVVCPTCTESHPVGGGIIHAEVVNVFHKTCLYIRELFYSHHKRPPQDRHSTDKTEWRFTGGGPHDLIEHGVMFQRNPENSSEQKKGAQVLKYWVIGRLLLGKHPREFYVCHHVSASQTSVELAFKLGFGIGP